MFFFKKNLVILKDIKIFVTSVGWTSLGDTYVDTY